MKIHHNVRRFDRIRKPSLPGCSAAILIHLFMKGPKQMPMIVRMVDNTRLTMIHEDINGQLHNHMMTPQLMAIA